MDALDVAGEDEEESKVAESVDQDWRDIKTWLTAFDTQLKGAIVCMGQPAADETKPFAEKYEAREILTTLAGEIKESWLEKSAVIKAAKALIHNRLG